MAGYSEKSLSQKLGLKRGMRILALNAPDNYEYVIGDPSGVIVTHAGKLADLIHFFTKSREDLTRNFPALRNGIAENGTVWISWPKKSSRVTTDLDENIIRDIGLSNGMVDVKVCAVDEIWSALKFVIRLKDRKK